MKRRAALILIVALCTACGMVVGPDPSTSEVALFDRVWHDLDLHYSFFVVKQVNWDSLGAVYRPGALAAQNDDALAPVLVALLSNLHDGHILLGIGGNAYATNSSPYPNRFDPTITFAKYVQSIGGFSNGLSYGLVTPTVGYIRFSSSRGTTYRRSWIQRLHSLAR